MTRPVIYKETHQTSPPSKIYNFIAIKYDTSFDWSLPFDYRIANNCEVSFWINLRRALMVCSAIIIFTSMRSAQHLYLLNFQLIAFNFEISSKSGEIVSKENQQHMLISARAQFY